MKFRTLKANEIECRVSTVKENGFSILLYKDARCDMNILDETIGGLNWMREHARDNANCIVSIWDEDKKRWISKEDTGTESFTEKEKGLASDSFKRACFNWGIGRELYTAPFIWINANSGEVFKKGNGYSTDAKMFVKSIEYNDDRTIKSVVIIDKEDNVRFPAYSKQKPTPVKKAEKHKPKVAENAKVPQKILMKIREAETYGALKLIYENNEEYSENIEFMNSMAFRKDEITQEIRTKNN